MAQMMMVVQVQIPAYPHHSQSLPSIQLVDLTFSRFTPLYFLKKNAFLFVHLLISYSKCRGDVYTMDHEVVPMPCKVCDWLLNLSQDHFGLHKRKQMSEWPWRSRSPKDILQGLHYPLTWSNGFCGGRGKRALNYYLSHSVKAWYLLLIFILYLFTVVSGSEIVWTLNQKIW